MGSGSRLVARVACRGSVGYAGRLGLLGLLGIAAGSCSESKTGAVADGPTPARVAQAVPPPVAAPRPAVVPDAAAAEAEPAAMVFLPADVLQGAAAEHAIGESAAPPAPPPDPDTPALAVTPLGVGPYALGLPRQAIVRLLDGASLARARTAPGEPSIEVGEVIESGAHLLHLVLYAGRLLEVTVLTHDVRAVTAADIGVGSTFDDAELAHGEPRKVKRGWVLSALPGVVFVPADAALLTAAVPPPEAKIGRLIVVGPEAD